MLKHKGGKEKEKNEPELCTQGGTTSAGKKEKMGGKDEKEIQIVPPIPWVPQKGIFRLTQKENTNYIQKGVMWRCFQFFWRVGEKKEKNLHIVRGSRTILIFI